VLFNSVDFALFLPVVFCLYWWIANGRLRIQNALLLIASYFFYACWDWRFLFLLMFSTLLDYASGLKMHNVESVHAKRKWLWLSVGANLGFLGIFKYYNFFAVSFSEALSGLGIQVNPWTLSVILPVGISFYTFHGLSYVFDIYNGKIKPEKNIIDYGLFVSFFPLLVAGPIERATHLLPQLKVIRNFEYAKATDGLRQILWGLFKKMVIADNCAEFANLIFDHSVDYSGVTLVMGSLFFAFQIYGDFSGYSDIAIGTAKLFGIDLFRNFAFPYFSKNIAEFWKRWHISLTSWFKDYLYIPLGGSQAGFRKQVRNIFIVFIVSGFWHGANWTFIIWGLLHALFFLILLLMGKSRVKLDISTRGRIIPSGKDFIAMAFTFGLTVFAWIFFRAENLNHAFQYVTGIFIWNHDPLRMMPNTLLVFDYWLTILFVVAFMVYEWFQRDKEHGLQLSPEYPVRNWCIYIVLAAGIVLFAGSQHEFIYFQF
jgi:D-alanyl-lipoteichoic acid acyltransferase DltB (MBOAT superfamily)